MTRRDERIAALAIALIFLAVRAGIAWARDPFFDELFTVWLARRPFSGILPALLHDSGPPLYYFLARIPSVMGERALATTIAAVPMVLLFREKRWTAAMLLAVHPAAALFAATARPYALCGALLAIGILLLERERVGGAAVVFVAAAYTHFAGAFFLPLLLLGRAPLRRRLLVCVLAGIAFLPALWLATTQPRAATAWMTPPNVPQMLSAFAFLSDDPGAPVVVTLLTFALTAVAVSHSWRYAPYVLIPFVAAIGLSFLRPAYFPIRFASLIAFPLVLWIEDSLARWGRVPRAALLASLVTLGFGAIVLGIITHLQRPLGDYREAALILRQHLPPGMPVVATGYLYLESVAQLGDTRVQAFPAEQATHPGWRVLPTTHHNATALPRGAFLWIGERLAPEGGALRGRRTAILFENERAVIVNVGPAP